MAIKSASDGRVWVSLRAANALAGIDPLADDPGASTVLVRHPLIDGPAAIFPASDGRLWFTTTGRPGIGSLDPAAAEPASTVALLTPPGVPALRAWAQDRAGRLWITTRAPGGVACFDPADPAGSWQPLAGPEFGAPDGATLGPDGAIWVVDTERNAVVRIDPDTGQVTAVTDPAFAAPFDLKPGPGTTLWFTNRGAPTIGRIRLD